MCCSFPIVTSNHFGTKEIADEAAVFVNPEAVKSIADGMHQVITDEELRERLIKAGHERFRKFSWGKCAQETLLVLKKSYPREIN